MDLTRRTLLGMLSATPLAVAAGCSCGRPYPLPLIGPGHPVPKAAAILRAASPDARAAMVSGATRVVDVHAHFFNASDVPVRGFVAESLAHRAPTLVRRLLEALAPIADRLAANAPTAADELTMLQGLLAKAAPAIAAGADPRPVVATAMDDEARATTRRLANALRGSRFQRLYREMKVPEAATASAQPPSSPISDQEIYDVVVAARSPATPEAAAAAIRAEPSSAEATRAAADGVLGFLFYMLSYRSSNLDVYMDTFARREGSFGVDTVLGSLVDFDYWLDCPPLSAYDDQVVLHALLSELSGGYLRPIVAYNPWTDINQEGAGLARVLKAVRTQGFVGVKIYPPTGFRPAGNAATTTPTSKRRPDLKKLDERLEAFFDACARERIPVLAHANRSNGRDDAHDEFSSPEAWRQLLARYATRSEKPVIDVGHFGGGSGVPWTDGFAQLMADVPTVSLYGDLGYWEELICLGTPDAICQGARDRLRQVLNTTIDSSKGITIADRVMFGTDWLMLSRVRGWADYPAKFLESVKDVAPGHVEQIFAGNAAECFGV